MSALRTDGVQLVANELERDYARDEAADRTVELGLSQCYLWVSSLAHTTHQLIIVCIMCKIHFHSSPCNTSINTCPQVLSESRCYHNRVTTEEVIFISSLRVKF